MYFVGLVTFLNMGGKEGKEGKRKGREGKFTFYSEIEHMPSVDPHTVGNCINSP